MIGILFQLLLWVQGVPTLPNQGGTITGTLLTEEARPAAHVRIAAMVQPENVADVSSAASLASIAETDELGRFQLENVPPGRYYVTAGRVENPTYFPGTVDIAKGRIVTVEAGLTVSSVNFSLNDYSDRAFEMVNAAVIIPVEIHFDGARVPIFSEHGKVALRLVQKSDGRTAEMPLSRVAITLPNATGEYRVSIENLPDEYEVRSLQYGSVDLMSRGLLISMANLPKAGPDEQISLTNLQSGVLIKRRAFGDTLQITGRLVPGSITSTTVLSVAVGSKQSAASVGIRVQGKVENAGQVEVYLSGKPGILFSDGTFEFRNVQPGRYFVAMINDASTSRQHGAVVTVGDHDVTDLKLEETNTLPIDVLSEFTQSGPPANELTSSMHSIRGHVTSASTHMPVAGIVTLRGYARSITYSLPADGEFEISNLLSGSYGLQIETFESSRINKDVVVGSDDVDLNLSVP
jgi:hypothetical protein